jgi:RNA polymerase sigma-70 factor (ECF subfamily)
LSKYLFAGTLHEEKEILRRIKDPDSREMGFNQLVVAYQQRLYWHIRKMVIDHDV